VWHKPPLSVAAAHFCCVITAELPQLLLAIAFDTLVAVVSVPTQALCTAVHVLKLVEVLPFNRLKRLTTPCTVDVVLRDLRRWWQCIPRQQAQRIIA
jgi:hypothetical protein